MIKLSKKYEIVLYWNTSIYRFSKWPLILTPPSIAYSIARIPKISEKDIPASLCIAEIINGIPVEADRKP